MERYRITSDFHCYFVTYSVVAWLPVFIDENSCRIVTDSLTYCHREKQLRINAFVIMPTHLHPIVFDAQFDSGRLSKTLADFRKFTGRNVGDLVDSRCTGMIGVVMRDAAGEDRERRFWQPTRHPEGLETERFWRQKLDYLHENPVRKGLVRRGAEWRFSSAAWYVSDGTAPSDVPISRLCWD